MTWPGREVRKRWREVAAGCVAGSGGGMYGGEWRRVAGSGAGASALRARTGWLSLAPHPAGDLTRRAHEHGADVEDAAEPAACAAEVPAEADLDPQPGEAHHVCGRGSGARSGTRLRATEKPARRGSHGGARRMPWHSWTAHFSTFARWGRPSPPSPSRPRPHPRRLRHYHPLPQDGPDVQPRGRTVQLPPLKHVIPSPPQGSERSKTWEHLPKRSIDPLPPVRRSGVSRSSADSSYSGASSQAPHSSPDGPGVLAIETHAMGMVDETLYAEAMRLPTLRSSLCAIL